MRRTRKDNSFGDTHKCKKDLQERRKHPCLGWLQTHRRRGCGPSGARSPRLWCGCQAFRSLSHPLVTQQRGPPAWESVGLKRKIPLRLQWGKAFLTCSRPKVCSHIVRHAWPPELNKSEALAAAREALLALVVLVWAEKIRPWGEDSWPECSPSSHSQPSSGAPHIGAQG